MEFNDQCTAWELLFPPNSSVTVMIVCRPEIGVAELIVIDALAGLATSFAACIVRVIGKICDAPDVES